MTETIRLVRMWLVAGVSVVALLTSCTALENHNRRQFKEAALARGMSAQEIDCAWDSAATGNGVTKPQCIFTQKP